LKFILTIDTEGDNQWDHGRELTVENIKFVPRFQKLCEKYLIKPTYLVTSEVCEDAFARKFFSDLVLRDKAEIGTHLHSWTTPPFLNRDGFRYNDPNHAFATEVPEELLIDKVRNITNQIESAFGKRPLSYRSGRFGFDENLARILADNSYLIDSSVTPYCSWTENKGLSDGKGGPDFLESTPFPYRYNFENNSLLEIPVTILPTSFPFNRYNKLAVSYFRNVDKSIMLKVLRKLFYRNQPIWLRPNSWMNIHLFNNLLDEAARIKLPYLVMMFHSSELMPGCSIYRPDEDSIERLYGLLELFFVSLREKNVASITLIEAAKSSKV
jgi:hypothetical protein